MEPEHSFLSLLTGSFATPAAENPTVVMVEAAYRELGLNARYINCEVAPAALGNAVRGARAMGFAGFNCSLPHKLAVIEHLDSLGESAALIGAVNCVVDRGGLWVGENTDGRGFVDALRGVIDPAGRRVMLLGAGGAARAIAVELALAGAASLIIVNRDRSRAEALARHVAQRTPAAAEAIGWSLPVTVPESVDVLVNATSIGLYPEVDAMPAVDAGSLRPGLIVADVIPNPPRTRLLQLAAARGCITVDGLGMLVNQGLVAIAHWTGRRADARVMRRALEQVFGTA